jgi:hypothetical protein
MDQIAMLIVDLTEEDINRRAWPSRTLIKRQNKIHNRGEIIVFYITSQVKWFLLANGEYN